MDIEGDMARPHQALAFVRLVQFVVIVEVIVGSWTGSSGTRSRIAIREEEESAGTSDYGKGGRGGRHGTHTRDGFCGGVWEGLSQEPGRR